MEDNSILVWLACVPLIIIGWVCVAGVIFFIGDMIKDKIEFWQLKRYIKRRNKNG